MCSAVVYTCDHFDAFLNLKLMFNQRITPCPFLYSSFANNGSGRHSGGWDMFSMLGLNNNSSANINNSRTGNRSRSNSETGVDYSSYLRGRNNSEQLDSSKYNHLRFSSTSNSNHSSSYNVKNGTVNNNNDSFNAGVKGSAVVKSDADFGLDFSLFNFVDSPTNSPPTSTTNNNNNNNSIVRTRSHSFSGVQSNRNSISYSNKGNRNKTAHDEDEEDGDYMVDLESNIPRPSVVNMRSHSNMYSGGGIVPNDTYDEAEEDQDFQDSDYENADFSNSDECR